MVMLRRKMFRDIKQNLSQFITIFLMVFIGVLVYSGIRSYMDGMKVTANTFYKDYNLQDLNVVGKFTSKDLEKIKNLEYVNNAERKLTIIGTMEHNSERTLHLNFIESNNISKFYIVSGEKFDINRKGVWLDEYYASNNDLKVGDIIKIRYDDIIFEEKILGLINVPDHVYDIKDESAIFPNHIDYGFAYLSINEIPEDYIKNQVINNMNITNEKILDNYDLDNYDKDFNYKDIVYNNIMVDVDNENNKKDVKNAITENIDNTLAVTDIEDSISYASYQGEIEEGETYVGIFSGLFLFIAILSVITTMTRVVKKQRIQTGTLKALGFNKKKIAMHYVGYGFFISLIATILGILVGPLFLGNLFIGMEMSYFQIPNGRAVVAISSFIVGIIVVFAVSLVTYLTCRKQLKENPAETLRVQMPKVKKGNLGITAKGILKKLSFSSKWNLRDMIRNKMRTIMGIAGIAGCTMLLVCAFGLYDSMNEFIDWQFDDLYNFDYKITLKEDYTDDQYKSIIEKYGNFTSQTLNIEFKFEDGKESNNIFVTDAGNYVRFTDEHKNFITLDSDDGVYVTEKLASTKNLKIGDTITWHIYGDDDYYESKIIGFNRNPQNQNITMTKKYLQSLGISYKADNVYTNKDLSDIKEIDGAELIQNIDVLKEGMSNMLETMKTMIILLIIVAALLGSVIIYNMGILSFTEKQYQFATLKVLGFNDRRIKKIYIKQNNWITLISIIIGLPLGFYMVDFIFKMALSDSYDFNASIKLISYIYAVVGTIVISFIVSKILAKKINKIDMVTSLKGNE